MDDDSLFTERTKIENLVTVLESTDATIVGGDVPLRGQFCYFIGKLTCVKTTEHKTDLILQNSVIYEVLEHFPKCYRLDIVPNFFISTKESIISSGGWDEDLFVMEHEDFFLRQIYNGHKVVFCQDVRIEHVQLVDFIRLKRLVLQNYHLQNGMAKNGFSDFRHVH
ncbi:Beta-1,4 N-acetylgalactosaminyltransferase 1 [Thelohanellus kitauei]|uniref:Beta-1,4 N-acetylgalactosaminyltransferase 1 n=1 Tax=Thelohanellus kitauei TaxID=669202 RepID=A0A0C2N7M5_THEKT|nr:Beta-1,4 N-acetylgalactosaminyltransferase 1 [Thelohanellus kitauei]